MSDDRFVKALEDALRFVADHGLTTGAAQGLHSRVDELVAAHEERQQSSGRDDKRRQEDERRDEQERTGETARPAATFGVPAAEGHPLAPHPEQARSGERELDTRPLGGRTDA